MNESNDCEFLHDNQNSDTSHKLAEADKMINQYKADVKALKGEIFQLKGEVVKKKSELDSISTEMTNKNNSILKNKDSEISKLKAKFNKYMETRSQGRFAP